MSDLAIDPKKVFKTNHGFCDDALYHKRIVVCPACGCENVHIVSTEIEDGEDDYKSSGPYRGDLLKNKFWCEAGHSFELCFGFHKGNTFTFFRFPDDQKTEREDYYEYIQSEAWKERARVAKDRAGNKCQVCNSSTSLHAHHRTYERLGNELPEDITVLCAGCHYLYESNKKINGVK